jgi:cytochrome c553
LWVVAGGVLSRLVVGAEGGAGKSQAGGEVGVALFRSDVRELLTTHCLKCHGGEKTKGDFDLSSREGLLHPGAEGANVVPGDARKSRLMAMVRHEVEPAMPEKAGQLPAAAIDVLARWIDAGAPYDRPLIEKGGRKRDRSVVGEEDRRFWSFLPLATEVAAPAVKDAAGWVRTPVDRFVLAKLEEKGIAPNPAADRRRLIRRAYLDLTGLPPGPEEVESFVDDPDPQAWEGVVERLLASPAYGERWARHWLDVARFAESHGYEHDYDRPTAYHYRDFVIRALNEDMAYDRFVRLQVAGDELEPGNPQGLLATGYLAAGTHATQVTAATAEKERYDEMDDMASTVGTSLLGLTVGCARCHDHKFDAIPAKDYYRLVATFTTTVRTEAEIDSDPAGYQKEKGAFDREHAALVEAVAAYEKGGLAAKFDAWLAGGGRAELPTWVVADGRARAYSGATMTRLEDGSYRVSGKQGEWDDYVFTVDTPLTGITGIKVEALSDPGLVKGGPGRAENGNFALSDVVVYRGTEAARGPEQKLRNPRATFEQKGLGVANTVDEDGTSGWAVDPQFGKDHAAAWELATPLDGAAGPFTVHLKFHNNVRHGIGRPRLSLTTAVPPLALDGRQGGAVALAVNAILDEPADRWTAEERAKLLAYYRTIDPEHVRLSAAVRAHAQRAPRPKKYKALVCGEGVPPLRLHKASNDIPDFYEKTYVLKRGEPHLKDGEAAAGFLGVLTRAGESDARWRATPAAGAKQSYRRAALANWLTDVEAGAGRLLARVIVNRLWQHHMGRGLVATPNDFGTQGARPTHPELLDYLARRLVDGGWRLKPIHKLIMTSGVYTQSTAYDEARAAVDRENLLWWRRPVRRLEGEAVRDSMLAVGGLLDPAMYGPGSLDESMRRRSVYFFVKRSKLIPMMMLFDWPDALQGVGQRGATTVAPQALAMMNHPQVQAYAAGFAKRVASERSVADAVRRAYAMALARPPAGEELADAVAFVEEQARALAADGATDARERALALFCQALFGLNEFIYIE